MDTHTTPSPRPDMTVTVTAAQLTALHEAASHLRWERKHAQHYADLWALITELESK